MGSVSINEEVRAIDEHISLNEKLLTEIDEEDEEVLVISQRLKTLDSVKAMVISTSDYDFGGLL